jgi:two-component system nitrate/nitrite response regulator NarL
VMHGTHEVSDKRIRVGVVEATRMSSQLIAEALKHRRNNFDVLAFAEDSSEAFRELQNYEPHVAIISAELHDGPFAGFDVLHQLRVSKSKAAPVMLLDSDERELVIDAFRAGARGIFCRRQSFEALPKCIRSVYQGQIWANNNQLECLLDLLTNLRALQPLRRVGGLLTQREQEVVKLVTKGTNNHGIALELGLTQHTVRNYLSRIFEKLGVSSRVELVLYAIDQPATDQRRPAR